MALAYSYLRFSSAKQAKGDSIRRQTEATDDWCKRHGASLDASLTLRDEGVSAFRGKHRGEFERALSDLQSGHIKVLVVFKLDRVIRNMWDLLRLERVLAPALL